MSNFHVTPHINVQNEIGFGKTVLMPGDPLRAKIGRASCRERVSVRV